AHTGSGYWMTTGHPHPNRNGESLEPSNSDWPHLGAVAKRLLPGTRGLPPVVTLPEFCKNNPGVLWPGQSAGFMPPAYSPFLVECDPGQADFQVSGLKPIPGLAPHRLETRRGLLTSVNRALDQAIGAATFARED